MAGAILVLAGLSFSTPLGAVTTNPRFLVPLVAVGAGAFVAWYQIDERQGRHWSSRTVWERTAFVLQPVLGVTIATAGVVILVTSDEGLAGVWNGALAALAVLVGAVVIAAPFVLRLWRGLQREQAERVRATERADIAAHLHDSVLQTLALIQRRSDDPQTVQRLARSQERELRSWLYAGQEAAADRLAGAITAEVNEVEDEHGVPVELVVTGDRAMTAEGDALVKATREALLNAVRHGRPPVTVYVEVGTEGAEVFVRDHGDGFELREIAEDRLGVRESILGRMKRAGGGARIRRLEQGTEIALSLPPLAHEPLVQPPPPSVPPASVQPPAGERGPAPARAERTAYRPGSRHLEGNDIMSDRVRLVLVDDHRMFRSGVKAELDPESTEVVGEAADVDNAVAVIREARPDVVLLDVHLPGGMGNGGVDVLVGCRGLESERGRPVRFLALSVSDAAEDVIAVIRAGARGYVTKTISGSDLSRAIRRVSDGDAVFSPRLAGFVLDAFGAAAGEIAEVDEELDRLSAREREVMRLIARGYQYKEVAKELFISVKTVETHVSSVLRKLQLSSRHELTAWAAGRRLL